MQDSRSNYERYRQAALNRPEAYPIGPAPDLERYRPLAAWLGRMVLPDLQDRVHVSGAWLEVQHAPPEHSALERR